MTNIPTTLLALLLMIGTIGCGKKSETDSGSDAGAPEKLIGYSSLDLTNPFFKTISDVMTETAAEKGYKVITVSGDSDSKKQSDQINDFIVKGVSAIILNPCDSKAVGTAIKAANDAGIPVFTNDLAYDGDVGKVVCHVATDNLQGGKLAGEAMVKLLGEAGGKVAILDFPQAESCQQRVKGFTEIINTHNAAGKGSKINVAVRLDGGGARNQGFNAAKDAIQSHEDLAAVFAINDPSALGAHAAIVAAGKTDQIKIIGFDGQRIGKEAIRDGKIVCDPIQFPKKIASMTVDNIFKFFAGEEVPEEILIPSALYYQEDALKDPELQ